MLGGKTNKEIIIHVFSSLQSLEKYLDSIKKLVRGKEKTADGLVQHEKVIRCMRRMANKIQLDVAHDDWDAAVRSLKIFYGLNHMIRPELVSTLMRLSGSKSPLEHCQPKPVCH